MVRIIVNVHIVYKSELYIICKSQLIIKIKIRYDMICKKVFKINYIIDNIININYRLYY